MPELQYLPMLAVAREHLIGCSILAAFATVCVALRLYGRHFSIGYGWDDLLIVFAWLFSMSLVAEMAFLATIGDGYDFFPELAHFPALMNNFPTFMKVVLSFQLLYMGSLTLVKCSVLVFYMRVFATQTMQRLSMATIGFVIAWCVGHMFAMVFICHPVAFWWDISIPGGYCLDQLPIYVSLIITNILSDIVIMALPMVTIWELKMKTTEKLALTAAFALGIASVAIAIWRLVTVFQLDIAANLTGTVELAVFLCTMETVLALLCINIPLLRPLYRRFIVRQSSSKLDESGHGTYGRGGHSGGRSGVTPSRNKNDDVELDSYSKNRGFERSVYIEESNDNDSNSEKKLNPYNREKKREIVVKTEWTIDRHQ